MVHPTADAAVVIAVTVEQLLNRIFLQLFVDSRDYGEAFDCSGSAESPATAALALIVRDGDLALVEPVLVVGNLDDAFFILLKVACLDYLLETRSLRSLLQLLGDSNAGSVGLQELLFGQIREVVDVEREGHIAIVLPVVLDDLIVVLAEHLQPVLEFGLRLVAFRFMLCQEVKELSEGVVRVVLIQRVAGKVCFLK